MLTWTICWVKSRNVDIDNVLLGVSMLVDLVIVCMVILGFQVK